MVRLPGWYARVVLLSMFGVVFSAGVSPADGVPDPGTGGEFTVDMVSPASGSQVAESRPEIVCVFAGESPPQNLLVFLDGVDVTAALERKDGGFTYIPVEALDDGVHTVSVVVSLPSGDSAQKDFQFSSLRPAPLRIGSSNNDLTLVYEDVLKKPEGATYVPDTQLEGNLSTVSQVKTEKNELGLMANFRFLDRSIPVYAPERKGIDLVNYLITEKYTGEHGGIVAEIGDLQIQETMNTVQGLARRGARVAVGYGTFTLNSFVVNSQQVYGFRGGMGIEGTMDDHIFGVSGDLGLLEGKVHLRTIYVNGGEPGSSFGTYTAGGNRKGEALGLVGSGRFLDGKLNVDAEYDISDFDSDTTDDFDSEGDRAWNVKLGGFAGIFNYEALYEYTGRDYEVIGNLGLQRDRQGFSLRGGVMGQTQSLNVSFGRYQDNVEDDELFPRLVTYTGAADYSLNGFPQVPMGIGYQKTIMDTSQLPEFGFPVFTDMDMISGRVSYMLGSWTFGLQGSYSIQNDKTENDNDSTSTMVTLNPMYYSENLSFSPSLGYNRSWFKPSDVATDTWTLGLDLRGNVMRHRVTYELAGTFNRTKADDDSMEMDSLSSNFRVMYLLVEKLWGVLNPSVGFRGLYNKTEDKIYDQNTDEFTVLFVAVASMGFSL